MTTNHSGECTQIVQVRFAGTRPVAVLCGEPGTYRPSIIYSGDGFIRCDKHYPENTGRYLAQVRAEKLNHMSFELPIPGVW